MKRWLITLVIVVLIIVIYTVIKNKMDRKETSKGRVQHEPKRLGRNITWMRILNDMLTVWTGDHPIDRHDGFIRQVNKYYPALSLYFESGLKYFSSSIGRGNFIYRTQWFQEARNLDNQLFHGDGFFQEWTENIEKLRVQRFPMKKLAIIYRELTETASGTDGVIISDQTVWDKWMFLSQSLGRGLYDGTIDKEKITDWLHEGNLILRDSPDLNSMNTLILQIMTS